MIDNISLHSCSRSFSLFLLVVYKYRQQKQRNLVFSLFFSLYLLTYANLSNNHATFIIVNRWNMYCRLVLIESFSYKFLYEESKQEVEHKKLLLVLTIYELISMILPYLNQVNLRKKSIF